jgi:hypothetical protein
MKNEKPLQTFNIDTVDSLESYLFTLGILCISVKTLVALQQKVESLGIFDADENEASEAVKHQATKLFVACDDLLNMCSNRTNDKDWPKLLAKVVKKATPKVEKPIKKKIKK